MNKDKQQYEFKARSSSTAVQKQRAILDDRAYDWYFDFALDYIEVSIDVRGLDFSFKPDEMRLYIKARTMNIKARTMIPNSKEWFTVVFKSLKQSGIIKQVLTGNVHGIVYDNPFLGYLLASR